MNDKYKRYSIIALAMVLLVTIFSANQAIQLKFDYDFEKFFPQEDDDLDFFKEYRSTFENDNDFVLFALKSENGIFNQVFLKKVIDFTDSLKKLPHVREVISPIEAQYPKLDFSSIGEFQQLYFHVDQPEKYLEDSLFILTSKDPISSVVELEKGVVVIVLKNKELINKADSDELSKAIKNLVDQTDFKQIYVIGKILGQQMYIDIMKVEFATFMGISIIILIIFLIIAYRSFWGILIPMTTVLLSVVLSLGIMQLFGRPLNMMTTLLPVIMLVVGMSDVVHLVAKYLEEIRLGRTKVEAIKNMLKNVGLATLLTSITTALGFVTLIFVNMEPVKDFGIFTAVGVMCAFLVAIVFIPAIFYLVKVPKVVDTNKSNSEWDHLLRKFFLWLLYHRKAVLGSYIFIAVISIAGMSLIKFDYFLMQELGENDPLAEEMRFFEDNFEGIRPFEMAIVAKKEGSSVYDFEVMHEINKMEDYLTDRYQVGQMISPTTPFKYINRAMRSGKPEFYTFPDKEKRYEYISEKLQDMGMQAQLKEIISEDGKMARLSGRMVDPGSREVLFRNDTLQRFYETQIDTTLIDYKLTGTPVIIDKSSRYLAMNVLTGLGIAFLLIAVIMSILFKSIKMGLISLIPNLYPILMVAGIIGFFGVDLNITTSIVFTVAFGIAVDDTIHFLSRYAQEIKKGKSNLYAIKRTYLSTGKAIVITSIILLGGFSSLIFSSFMSTFYIGVFVSLTLLFAVITDMMLLPLVLMLLNKDKVK
jgi:hypothetical protein